MIIAGKLKYSILLILLLVQNITAQGYLAEQFSFAKHLYEKEEYFDAVTELKRLLFFNETIIIKTISI